MTTSENITKALAWREAYLAATPEEQAVMLAKRKADIQEEEKRRKQQVYDDRKERYTRKAKHQIEAYELLLKAREVAVEVIGSFDGKVLNNRLRNVIETKLKEIDSQLFCSLSIGLDYTIMRNSGCLTIKYYSVWSNMHSSIEMIIRLSESSEWTRVDFRGTKERDNVEEVLRNRIEGLKGACNDYDKCYEEAEKIEKVLESYAHDVHSSLREFFQSEGMFTYKCYL